MDGNYTKDAFARMQLQQTISYCFLRFLFDAYKPYTA